MGPMCKSLILGRRTQAFWESNSTPLQQQEGIKEREMPNQCLSEFQISDFKIQNNNRLKKKIKKYFKLKQAFTWVCTE